jgi:hypothetical protein
MDQWQNKGAIQEPTKNKDSARENAPNFCRVPWTEFYNTSPKCFHRNRWENGNHYNFFIGPSWKFKNQLSLFRPTGRTGRTIHF